MRLPPSSLLLLLATATTSPLATAFTPTQQPLTSTTTTTCRQRRHHSSSTQRLMSMDFNNNNDATPKKNVLNAADVIAKSQTNTVGGVLEEANDAPKLFSEEIYADFQSALLKLERRVKDGKGSLTGGEVKEFDAETGRIVREMKEFLNDPEGKAKEIAIGYGQVGVIDAVITESAAPALPSPNVVSPIASTPVTTPAPAPPAPAAPAIATTSNLAENEGPAFNIEEGYGLSRGTVNTYAIPGMDEMTAEEYREKLQETISARQAKRREDALKNRGGMIGNANSNSYLDTLSGGSQQRQQQKNEGENDDVVVEKKKTQERKKWGIGNGKGNWVVGKSKDNNMSLEEVEGSGSVLKEDEPVVVQKEEKEEVKQSLGEQSTSDNDEVSIVEKGTDDLPQNIVDEPVSPLNEHPPQQQTEEPSSTDQKQEEPQQDPPSQPKKLTSTTPESNDPPLSIEQLAQLSSSPQKVVKEEPPQSQQTPSPQNTQEQSLNQKEEESQEEPPPQHQPDPEPSTDDTPPTQSLSELAQPKKTSFQSLVKGLEQGRRHKEQTRKSEWSVTADIQKPIAPNENDSKVDSSTKIWWEHDERRQRPIPSVKKLAQPKILPRSEGESQNGESKGSK